MKEYKILVVSDSHGRYGNLQRAIERELPFDVLVHCGDVVGDIALATGENPPYEVRVVKGNCDFGGSFPEEEEFKVGFCNLWVTHGNRYNVKYEMELSTLKKAAKGKRADIVLFGHTHCQEMKMDDENNILLLNPGSIGESRFGNGYGTYATIKITEDYEIFPEMKQI
ncbi:MAG: YfcE family phosphodiesterase [Lachnospiraceae bacterium]|jgi:hypothetical protein|nr:YfcE family phosphodiesterase [Lachnospiraceae bacterium]